MFPTGNLYWIQYRSKDCFRLPGLISEVLWLNNTDFCHQFGYDWIVGASSHLIRISTHSHLDFGVFFLPPLSPHHPWAYLGRHFHSTTSPYPGFGTKCERLHKQPPTSCHFRGLFAKRAAQLHLLEQNIFANIHAR